MGQQQWFWKGNPGSLYGGVGTKTRFQMMVQPKTEEEEKGILQVRSWKLGLKKLQPV